MTLFKSGHDAESNTSPLAKVRHSHDASQGEKKKVGGVTISLLPLPLSVSLGHLTLQPPLRLSSAHGSSDRNE